MMKLTEQEVKLFKVLQDKNNNTAQVLREYLQRVIEHYGDVRTMGHDDVQARRDALDIIEQEILNRLKPRPQPKQVPNGNKFN